MKKELDIQVKICEIENEISKENKTGSSDRVSELKIVLRTLNWVLENDIKF